MTLNPDNLEQALADLTAAPEDKPELWRKALDQSNRAPARPTTLRRLRIAFTPQRLLAASLILFVGVAALTVLLPRSSAPHQPFAARTVADQAWKSQSSPSPAELSFEAPVAASRGLASGFVDLGPSAAPSAPRGPNALTDRSVVRKATIELITPDVRAAFAKAAHLISDAQGEYVQDSSLTGEGRTTQGQLTLRIALPRLSAVLDELRQLGTVRSETSGGEDVTAQAVDLDARIRNEQRVETELLQLLEKRAEAPLKEILELRQSLSDVRQAIERLAGERQRLSRLVDLATVLVLIRAPEEPAKPAATTPPPTLSDYFRHSISASWRSSLEFLSDTLANLLALAIGGLIWWMLAAIAIYGFLRYRRAALAHGV
jgi:hypothetical protein